MADPTAPSHQVAEVGEVSFRSPQHRGQRPTSTAASLQIARGMGVHQSEGPITGGNGVLASLRSSPHGIAANIFLVACTRLYTPLCPSVGRLVGPHFTFFINFISLSHFKSF